MISVHNSNSLSDRLNTLRGSNRLSEQKLQPYLIELSELEASFKDNELRKPGLILKHLEQQQRLTASKLKLAESRMRLGDLQQSSPQRLAELNRQLLMSKEQLASDDQRLRNCQEEASTLDLLYTQAKAKQLATNAVLATCQQRLSELETQLEQLRESLLVLYPS